MHACMQSYTACEVSCFMVYETVTAAVVVLTLMQYDHVVKQHKSWIIEQKDDTCKMQTTDACCRAIHS